MKEAWWLRGFQRRDIAWVDCRLGRTLAGSTDEVLTSPSHRVLYALVVPVVKRLQKIGPASRIIIVGPPMLRELGWEPDETIAMEIVGNVLLVRARDAEGAPEADALEAGVKRLVGMLRPKDEQRINPTWQQLLSALRDDGPATEAELAGRFGLTRHHTKRILVNAVNRGYVDWRDDKRFAFRPEAFLD